MKELIAACGIDCAACPAYVATAADDRAALAKLAEDWGRQFGFSASPEQLRCHGCSAADGVQIGHCAECEIRLCALAGKRATCADCPEFACDKLTPFLKDVPEARARLEALSK
jgi:hypothetical protein